MYGCTRPVAEPWRFALTASISESIRPLLSWVRRLCSPGVLYSLSLLQSIFLHSLPQDSLWKRGRDSLCEGKGFIETFSLDSHPPLFLPNVRLWVSASVPICCWRKLLCWRPRKALIYEYKGHLCHYCISGHVLQGQSLSYSWQSSQMAKLWFHFSSCGVHTTIYWHEN